MTLPYLTPADIGRRVTARALRTDGSAFDTVGPLLALSLHEVEIGGRAGPVRLGWPTRANPDLAPVIAARVVKPDLTAVDMQRVAQAGWPPEESEDIGQWELRWAGGVSQRANSVRPGGDSGQPLGTTLERIRLWYRERGGVPTVQVPRPWLADELGAHGWTRERGVVLMTRPTRSAIDTTARGIHLVHAHAPDDRWLTTMDRDDAADARALESILTSNSHATFISALAPDGSMAGIGRGVIAHGWCGITSIVTAPAWRRRGVATEVTNSIIQWAHGRGIASCFLQVLETNAPARTLYGAAGFTVHHAYDYWTFRESKNTQQALAI